MEKYIKTKRNYLKKGDKIRTYSGKTYTVRFLEFSAVYIEEKAYPIEKKDIECILEL